jgi:SAM-dependent methyltransferase
MRRFLRRLAARFGPALESDTTFIEKAYREVLGRPADQDGLDHYRRVLADGLGRTAVILDLVRSTEFVSKLTPAAATLPNLIRRRPERYARAIDRSNGETVNVFHVESPSDIDWLERAILDNGYYEQPGVWTLGVDADKRLMAEIIASFQPVRVLELGCASGAVIECLEGLAIAAEGVEISTMAIERAAPRVRGRIHQGDLLTLDLPSTYDLVFGLDVFEHLNPNRLRQYLQRIAELLTAGGHLFVNVPAFGDDEVFDRVFPLYLDDWAAAGDMMFSTFHVDDLGYPLHGHLAWASSAWWVAQFEACGFARDESIERELHRKYDAHLKRRSPARAAFYVFVKPKQS